MLQNNDENRNISRVDILQSSKYISSFLSNRSTSAESSQSSIDIITVNSVLNLNTQMKIEDLIIIEETETTTVKPEKQREERNYNIDFKDFISPSSEKSVCLLSTKRKRKTDTILFQNDCRKQTRIFIIHVKDNQYKRK